MVNLIVILSVLTVVVSLWAIMYYAGRIINHYFIRGRLGDMPTREEISAMYDQNNATIEYGDTPPLKQKKPTV